MTSHSEAIAYWEDELARINSWFQATQNDLKVAAELVKQAAHIQQVKRLEHLFYGATVPHPTEL